jgi:hypothetical protein
VAEGRFRSALPGSGKTVKPREARSGRFLAEHRLDSSTSSARPGTEIVIRAGISSQVQGLGSVDVIDGALNDVSSIGSWSIPPIGGTASCKQPEANSQADWPKAATKRSYSGHGRGFLERSRPGDRDYHKYRMIRQVESRIPASLG